MSESNGACMVLNFPEGCLLDVTAHFRHGQGVPRRVTVYLAEPGGELASTKVTFCTLHGFNEDPGCKVGCAAMSWNDWWCPACARGYGDQECSSDARGVICPKGHAVEGATTPA